MRSLFRTKSLTKNWPGGRRLSTVIQTRDDWSFPAWNTRIVNTRAEWKDGAKTYLAPEPPKSEGGMAEPCDSPSTTT